jgi:hypothetical protein
VLLYRIRLFTCWLVLLSCREEPLQIAAGSSMMLGPCCSLLLLV